MTRLRTHSCVTLLFLCAAPEGLVAESAFTLSIEAPARIIEPAGTRRVETCFTVLSHEGKGTGAQGWSFGVESLRCSILAVTVEGTAADGRGFMIAESVDPSRNGGRTGFVSATVMGLVSDPELPPRASHRIAKAVVDFLVPREPETALLRFTEDLRGRGHFVPIRVTQDGNSFPPLWIDRIIDVGPPSFLRGDASSDGNLDIGDALWILEGLFRSWRPAPCEDAADANDDGRIDIADPIQLLGYLFLGGAPPPAPHPECGPDSTLDAFGCAGSSPCST